MDRTEEVVTKIWSGRVYRSTIEANFTALEQDLAALDKDKFVTIDVGVEGETGYWLLKLKRDGNSTWWKDKRFTGSPERVLRECREALSASCWSNGEKAFTVNTTQFNWLAPLNPITFRVTLYTREPAASATRPLVQLVPVLDVVKTEIVEVEVPVFIDRIVEQITVREPTDAEISAMIAARVEVELASMQARSGDVCIRLHLILIG